MVISTVNLCFVVLLLMLFFFAGTYSTFESKNCHVKLTLLSIDFPARVAKRKFSDVPTGRLFSFHREDVHLFVDCAHLC
jgi:hypothetical protein